MGINIGGRSLTKLLFSLVLVLLPLQARSLNLAHAQRTTRKEILKLKNELREQRLQLLDFYSELRNQQADRNGWTTIEVATKVVSVLATLASVQVAYGDGEALASHLPSQGSVTYNDRTISIAVSTAAVIVSTASLGNGRHDMFQKVRLRSADIQKLSRKIAAKIMGIERAENLLRSLAKEPEAQP